MQNKLDNRFFERLNEIYSKDDIKIILNWYKTLKRKPSFRINLIKSNENEVINELKLNWLELRKIDFIENCYVLEKWSEKDLWDLEIFKNWKIYLQQITSQIPVNFLDLKDWSKVLDVTAAPWSKTSQIASILNNTWNIIAIDNNQIRVDKLNFTLKRQWVKNTKVFKTDARNIQIILWEIEEKNWYSKDDIYNQFDSILFDAPCSAEWRFNFNIEKTYAYWKEDIIKQNYKLQKQILEKIIPLLKVWWTLVYSTCTLAPEENEAIVHLILSNYKDLEIQNIDLNYKYIRDWIKKFGTQIFNNNVTNSKRILPSEETEGFFIAKFKKIKS